MDVPCTGTDNCFGSSGRNRGALSVSDSAFQPAYGTNTGWDFATGIGSVNAYNLIQNWTAVLTTTAVASGTNPSTYGQSVTFTATISPAIGSGETGNVTWSANTACAPSAVSANVATCTTSSLPQGTDIITAIYSGDSNFAGGTATLSGGQTVNDATTTVGVTLTTGSDPSVYGQSLTFTATVSGEYGEVTGRRSSLRTSPGTSAARSRAVPSREVRASESKIQPEDVSGSVSWSANTNCGNTPLSGGVATCTTIALPVGAAQTVTATYAGDGSHTGNSNFVLQTVSQANTNTAVGSSENPSAYGQPVSFTATVTPVTLSLSTPSGSVQFYIDSSLLGTAPVIGGIATSISTSMLAVGPHTVTTLYSGDTNFNGGSGALSGGQVVNSTLTITPSSGVNFGTVYLNTLNKSVVTVTNTTATTMAISDVSITLGTADASSYQFVRHCAASLKAGQSCTIAIEFFPDMVGTLTATLNIFGNVPGSPQQIGLTGTAIDPVAQLSSLHLNFGTQALGSSTTLPVQVTNSGETNLIVGPISFTGSYAGEFSETDGCSAPVPPTMSCTIYVSFIPTVRNSHSATMAIADNAKNGKSTVTLAGSGQP